MRLLRSPEAKRLFLHSGGTLAATLAVQASSFFLLAAAAQILATDEFARLSAIVAIVMISSALFDFGLNVTATKIFGESHDRGVFSVAARIRIWTLLIVVVASLFFLVFVSCGCSAGCDFRGFYERMEWNEGHGPSYAAVPGIC